MSSNNLKNWNREYDPLRAETARLLSDYERVLEKILLIYWDKKFLERKCEITIGKRK